jgi:type VI secretion system protein ImpL
MKDIGKYWAAAAAMVVWLMLVWFAGSWLGLTSPNLWIFRGGLAVLSFAVFGWFVYWSKARQASRMAVDSSAASQSVVTSGKADRTDLDFLIRKAEQRLKSSERFRGATIANLPAFILLGEPGSGKTTTMAGSGLEPEILAGQISQDDSIVPTEWTNIWFARPTIFVEAGNAWIAKA